MSCSSLDGLPASVRSVEKDRNEMRAALEKLQAGPERRPGVAGETGAAPNNSSASLARARSPKTA
jgi:hypothetical protein